jgi:hypothetical protein
MSKPDFLRQKNKWLPKIKQWIEENRPGEKMVFYSASLEQVHTAAQCTTQPQRPLTRHAVDTREHAMHAPVLPASHFHHRLSPLGAGVPRDV